MNETTEPKSETTKTEPPRTRSLPRVFEGLTVMGLFA